VANQAFPDFAMIGMVAEDVVKIGDYLMNKGKPPPPDSIPEYERILQDIIAKMY